MGYHFDDFFREQVKDQLSEVFENQDSDTGETFLEAIRQICHKSRSELFTKRLLRIITDAEDHDRPEQVVQNVFLQLFDNDSVRKLEYSTDSGAIININFNGIDEEEKLNNG